MKADSCNWIELYTVCGRVLPLRTIEENRLQETKKSGDVSSNERKVTITPDMYLNKMVKGDYLSIPWGVRPNVYAPPSLPDNAGPQVWIQSPTGPQLLVWCGTKYVGDTLSLSQDTDGNWCLSGEITACIGASLICLPYPAGYGFLKFTGPLANFKILKIDEEEDEMGRLSFYTLFVEYDDTLNEYIQ